MNFFKPEDFVDKLVGASCHRIATDIANAKLQAAGVEVQCHIDSRSCDKDRWVAFEHAKMDHHTHKALLINIEPIKEETCADVLRDMIETSKAHEYINTSDNAPWIKRAKAALDRHERD